MYKQWLVLQDIDCGWHSRICQTIGDLAGAAHFRRLRVAVAFASAAGCGHLAATLHAQMRRWRSVTKQWLLGVDFGHTAPEAIEYLKGLDNSEVRVSDATFGLVPRRCFHPKTFIFDVEPISAESPLGVLIGSANLTLSGLCNGTEHATALLLVPPLTASERVLQSTVIESLAWWDKAWDEAEVASSALLSTYRKVRPPGKREDDSDGVRPFVNVTLTDETEGKLLRWAAARCLWVQTYELYKNRGPSRPGNQLDLPRGARVYFGFSPASVEPNTVLGEVYMQYGSRPATVRSVRFGDNQMDKVNLPVPGTDGPSSYDNAYVHFERVASRQFVVSLGTLRRQRVWRQRSLALGLLYQTTGGREYGFYS